MVAKKMVKKKNKLEKNWTARQLYDNHQFNLATFDNAVQRGLVWEKDKKSLFIHTLLNEGFVPPLYAAKYDGNDVYDFIDGKQRAYTVFQFKNDEFALEDVPLVEVLQEDGSVEKEDVNGKKYSELPDYMQSAIDGFSFEIKVLLNPAEDEIADTFYRLNNGKSLNAMTLSRVKAKDRAIISHLGKHELLKTALTEKAFANYTNEMIVVKAFMMLKEEDPGLEMKNVRPYMETLKITKEDREELIKVFDRILAVHKLIEDKKVAKRILTRTHMISIVPFILRSIEEGRTEEDVANWLAEFFNGTRSATKNEKYNSAAGTGSAHKDSVRKRNEVLKESYEDYMSYCNDNPDRKISEEVVDVA